MVLDKNLFELPVLFVGIMLGFVWARFVSPLHGMLGAMLESPDSYRTADIRVPFLLTVSNLERIHVTTPGAKKEDISIDDRITHDR